MNLPTSNSEEESQKASERRFEGLLETALQSYIKKKKYVFQRTMVESISNKKTVMVLGSLSTGKSCVLNRLSGVDLEEVEEPFPSNM